MSIRKKRTGYTTAVSVAAGVVRVLVYIAIIVAMIFLGRQAYSIGYSVFHQEPLTSEEDAEQSVVVITDDMSVSDIGKTLRDAGVIDESTIVFVLQERLSDYHDKILPGTYILDTSMTVDDILPILTQENTEGQPGAAESEEDADTSSGTAEGGTKV